MSSIDNRVVVLSFDNKDFERNVQTSMNTLDRLKNGLDLSGSAKGLSALSATARTFNLTPIGEAIEAIRDRFSNLGIVGITVLQNLTNTAVNFGKRLIGGLFEPLTAGGWKRALNIEQATFQMEGLIGKTENGAQKIEAIMASVKESVQGTAYGMDEAARVASQLVATGIEDSEKMLEYLKGVAGAAAMTGGSYDEIGHIFTTVAGNGRLMGDQLQQFAYRGLNVAATLSKQMGITEQEFRELVSKGQISFEQFANGMAEAFGEHATKANDTFTGSLSNMRAALARIGEEFSTPALKYFRDIFYSLKLLIDQVHERLKPLINLINEKLIDRADKFVNFIDSITEALGGESQRMKKAAEEAGEAVEETTEIVTKSSEEIEEAARRVINGEYGDGEERRKQLEALGLSYEEVQNKVNELLGCDYRYEVETKNVTDATNEATEATDNLAGSTEELNKQLGASILQHFLESLDRLRIFFTQIKNSVVEAFTTVFTDNNFLEHINSISEAFETFTGHLMLNGEEMRGQETVFETFFAIIEKAIEGILTIVEWGIKFATIFADIRKKILGFIGAQSDANDQLGELSRKSRFFEALGGVISKIGEAISLFKDKLGALIEMVKQTEGFQKLKEALSQVWEIIKELAGTVVDKIIEKMNDFAGMDLDFSWVEKASEIIGKIAGYLGDFIQMCIDGFPSVKDFFKRLFGIGDDDADAEGTVDKVDRIVSKIDVMEERLSNFGGDGGEKTNKFLDFVIKIRDFIIELKDNIVAFFDSNVDESMKDASFIENIKNFFIKFGGAMIKVATEVDLKEVLDAVEKLVLIIQILETLESIKGAFNAIKDVFEGIKNKLNLDPGPELTEKVRNIGIAIGLIAASLFIVASIPPANLKRAAITLGVMTGVIALVAILYEKINFSNEKSETMANNMIKMSAALLIVSAAMKVISGMSAGELVKAEIAIAGIIAIFVIASKAMDKVKSGTASFIAMSIAMDLLIPAILVFGNMKTEKLAQAGIAVVAFLTSMALAAKIAGNSVGAAFSFGIMALAIDLLIPAILVFGNMKTKKLEKAGTAVVAFLASMALATKIADSAVGAAVSFGIMAIALDLLIPAILVFGNMETGKLVQAGVAVVAFLTSMALATKIADGNISGAASMVIMSASLILVAKSLQMLADCDWPNILAGAAALSGVMLSMAAALKIAENVKPNILGFVAMLIPLAGAFAALYFLKDAPWDSLLAGGAALSMVMLSMAGALKIANDAQPLGALALDLVSVSLLPIALSLKTLADYDWQNLLGAATGMSEVLLACSIAMRVMAGMNPAIAAVTALSIDIAMGIIGGFVIAFTGILGKIDDWRNGGLLESVKKGREILEAVGEAIGAFIGGIGEGFTSTLPDIADNLTSFAEKLTPFFETMKGFGSEIASTISDLAVALLAITGAEFMDGIVSFVSGQSSLSQFGEELAEFGPALKNFWIDCRCIKEGDLIGAAVGMKQVAVAAGQIPNEGGLLAQLVGDNSLGEFAPQLLAFGPALKNFWLNCKSIQPGDLTGAAGALKEICSAADEIPNQGGWLAKVTGDNSLSTFGPELSGFASHLKSFWNECKDIQDGDLTGAANALKEICVAAQEIPNEGGWLAAVTGDNSLSIFGPELEAFGPALMSFATAVSGIESHSGSISVAVWALRMFVDAASEIENQGGFASLFTGDNTLSKFGEELEKYGKKLSAFMDKIKDVSLGRLSKIVSATIELVDAGVVVHDAGKDLYKDFGSGVKEFGEKLGDYYESIKDVSTKKISQVVAAVYELIEVGKEMAYVDTWAMGSFGTALANAGSVGVDAFVQAFRDGSSQAIDAVSSMISSAANGANGAQVYFHNAGVNGVQGLINGFASGQSAAYWTAYNICTDMVNACYAALQIRSPSKVMRKVGDFAGRGLVLGLKDNTRDLEIESNNAANTIVDAIAKPLETLQNISLIDFDIKPVITPVLDLSNVDQGVNTISGMLNSNPYLSFNAGYGGSIFDSVLGLAERMDASSGEGSIVNAINEIRSDVANLGAAITRMQIRLDGQTLVGEMVDPLDQALGERMDMRQRGLI